MPRRQRMYLPGIPVHVVQRGHNREACFFSDEDYQFYKTTLQDALERYGAQCHAYCLMTNHIHLLLTPSAENSIQRVIQHLGRQYVQYVNKVYGRSGSLWEGRYKGSLVAEDRYLLSCYRYIELNPVTAAMVDKTEEYPWSSFHFNGTGKPDPLITPHGCYLSLSTKSEDRSFAYRELFKVSLHEHDIHEIRESLSSNHLLGSSRFKEQVETRLGYKIGRRKRGRPTKQLSNT